MTHDHVARQCVAHSRAALTGFAAACGRKPIAKAVGRATRAMVAALLIAASTIPSSSSAQGERPAGYAPLTIETSEGTWMDLDVSPDGRIIVFALLGKIFVLPLAGGEARQITTGHSFEERPQFFPDGASVVFSSDRGGPVQLWRVELSESATPELMSREEAAGYVRGWEIDEAWHHDLAEPSFGAYTSPNRRYEIRSSRQAAPGVTHDCPSANFLIRDSSNGHERVLAPAGSDCGDAIMPLSSFTPDGAALITSFGGRLWRIAVPSGEVQEIPFHANVRLQVRPQSVGVHHVDISPTLRARRISGATLSPDGSQVAFTAFGRVWVMSLSDHRPRRLTSLNVGEFFPAWSPDGRHIAFVTWSDDHEGDGAIYAAGLDGEAPDRITKRPAYFVGLAYSPNGSTLYSLMRPIRALQTPAAAHGDLDGLEEVSRAELVGISASGGEPVTLDVIPNLIDPRRAPWGRLGGIAIHPGEPDTIVLYQPASMTEAQQDGAAMGSVRAIPAISTSLFLQSLTPVDLLRLRGPPPARDNPGLSVEFAELSPRRDKLLVVANTRQLLLIDVPAPGADGAPPTIIVDPHAEGVREITTIETGGEYPQWLPDGTGFTFSFGSTFHIYRLSGGARRLLTIPINVEASRDISRGALALRNARIITMRGDEVIERGDIVIENARIVAVGPSDGVRIPPNAHSIDLAGRTIIPGLIDLHNHVFPLAGTERSRVWQFEAALSYGVLAVRDPQALNQGFLSYQDRLDAGDVLGPRYFSTGPGIWLPSADVLETLAGARRVVSRYTDVYKTPVLKEYMLVRRDRRANLIMAASERGLSVTSHGAYTLKHLLQNAIDGYGGYDHVVTTVPLYGDVRRLLVATRITWAHANSWNGVEARYYSEIDGEGKARLTYHWPPNPVARINDRDQSTQTAMGFTLARIVAEGGHIAVGSHGDAPGIGTHMQMWAYAEGGMPNLEVLRAATLRGAEALGMERDLGSIEVGKIADLVVLNANPLLSIRHSARVEMIVLNGRVRDGLTLDALWPERRSVAAPWWVVGRTIQ